MNSHDRFNVASSPGANGDTADMSIPQLIGNLKALAAELVSHATYFVSAKTDGIKWSLTKAGMLAAIGLIALLALSGAVVTGVVLLLVGAANGFGAIFGPDLRWIGWLIIGALVLAIVFGGALLGMKILQGSTTRKTERKYETKRQRQQVEHGHDVRSRAADSSESLSAS